jgi:hypothetical protein
MQITTGVYYVPSNCRLIVVWSEIAQRLPRDEWRRHGATSLRQLAERDTHHVNKDEEVGQAIEEMSNIMGHGHSPAGVSMYDVSEFVPTARSIDKMTAGQIPPGVSSGSDIPQITEDLIA